MYLPLLDEGLGRLDTRSRGVSASVRFLEVAVHSGICSLLTLPLAYEEGNYSSNDAYREQNPEPNEVSAAAAAVIVRSTATTFLII